MMRSARRPARRARRRGAIAVAVLIVLIVGGLVVIGMVMGGAREQELSINRLDTVRAFYAAEAGMNMAIREMRRGVDADGDGGVGTVSDDGDDANNPAIGPATVVVTASTAGSRTTLTSLARSGTARRRLDATLEE